MRHTLMLLAVFVSLFCYSPAARAGGDVPNPLGSDVVWYQDTTGNSPFKKAFIGMWYAPDGKIVVPQGNQLFLVDPETGKVVEKKELGFDIKFYCPANDRFLLATDTVIYVYNKSTYELVKKLDLPESITKRPLSDFFQGRIHSYIDQLSPDGRTIIVGYSLKSGRTEMGKFDVETGKYEMIKHAYLSICTYSPDGKYFIANEEEGNEGARPVIYNADDLVNKIHDTGKDIEGISRNMNFSADSRILYCSGYSTDDKFFAIDLANNFKTEIISIPGNYISQIVGINDSLCYVLYNNHTNDFPSRAIMNMKNKSIVYEYVLYLPGADCYVAPQRKTFILMNYTEIYKVKIPYDQLSKTEEEITKINNGFILSPNPTYEQISFNLFLKQDEDLTYTIYTVEGKEIQKENIGKFGYGYANGTIYIGSINPGIYFIEFSGKSKIATGKLIIQNEGK